MSSTLFPLEPTAQIAQQTIRDEFLLFDQWAERYVYLIELGRKLPVFLDSWKTEEHRLPACQSKTWILAEGNQHRLDFYSCSESLIVSGLIYLALRVYSGRPAEEILATSPQYISDIGLRQNLSQSRNDGMLALLHFIQNTARHHLTT